MALLFEHIDDQFQKDLTSRCRLSLEVGNDRCAFAIADTLTNRVVYLLAFTIGGTRSVLRTLSELDKICSDRPWLLRTFHSTRALIRGSRYTMVPNSVFDPSEESAYLSLPGFQNTSTVFQSSALPEFNAHIVFDYSNSLAEALQRNWPGIELLCYESCLVRACYRTMQEGDIPSVCLNVDGAAWFQVAAFRGNKLLFLNTFQFDSREDFLYFLLASMEANQLSANSVNLKIAGDIERDGHLYEGIYRYVRNVNFFGRNDRLEYSAFFDSLPSHRFYTLIDGLT